MPIYHHDPKKKGYVEFAEYNWDKKIHTGIWFDPDHIIEITRALNGYNEKRGFGAFDRFVLPQRLKDALKDLREELLATTGVPDVGWYAKYASLDFVYEGEVYRLEPETLCLDMIDYFPDGKRVVGCPDSVFEARESRIREFLTKRLGIRYYVGRGMLD